jgi:iron complex outermembrane receptor protein
MPASQPTSRPATSQPTTMPFGEGPANDLTNLSLEDLMNVEVTSVARQKQRVGEAAAAITVITQEDIQRSGLTSVPELLRLVPGMDVARLNASTWAISSRGFNDAFANKLLVLSDGRSIYSPLFAGVFWDMHQPLLQDIEQIEVIRGPGATIWGSNAVNGVINIQSKSARDTQGLLVTGRGGNYEQSGAARFGGQIDDKTFFRFTGRYQNTDDFPTTAGPDGHDGWHAMGGAFRLDRYATDKDTFTVQGDLTSTREAETLLLAGYTPPTFMTPTTNSFNALGIDALGRWTHVFSDQSDMALQMYYDHLTRPVGGSSYHIDTGDIDFHHRFPLGDRQEIVWGLGYRYWADEFKPGPFASMNPENRDDYIASAFIQDDLTIVKDKLHLIGGTKVEENTYSGFEVQPSGRMVWTPDEQNTLWGAVSRAQRTPARWEQDGRIVSAPTASPLLPVPVQPIVHGTREFDSEGLNAFEVGYRLKPAPKFSLDTALFYNAYDHLRGFEPGAPGFLATPVPHVVVPVFVANSFYAESYGAEIAGNWQVTDRWRLAAS